jgi:hypothetical protein
MITNGLSNDTTLIRITGTKKKIPTRRIAKVVVIPILTASKHHH